MSKHRFGSLLSDEQVKVNLGEAAPRRLLVNWANGQDAWVRLLTAETIASRQEASADVIDKVYSAFLAEKRLSADPQPAIPMLELEEVEATIDDTLELVQLRNVRNVNALAENQTLEFDSDLTILFGQNGSGKTGYSRILKRISAVRTPEQVLPNAHLIRTSAPPTPSAEIAYKLSGNENVATWNDEAGLSPFTRISVFDADAVSLHVDSDLGYVYTPAELALFAHLAKGLQSVQQRIATEVATLKPGTNPLISRFSRGTTVYPVIETLGSATEIIELEQLASVAEDAEAEYERLAGEVAAIRSNALGALLESAKRTQHSLNTVAKVLAAGRDFSASTYTTALDALSSAKSRRARARAELFAESDLMQPADQEWQDFVEAGDRYRRHLQVEHYPEPGDRCLYCLQDLDDTALELLGRYREFLDEALIEGEAAAESALKRAVLTVAPESVEEAKTYLSLHLEGEDALPWAANTLQLIGSLEILAKRTVDGLPLGQPIDRAALSAAMRACSSALEAAEATVNKLGEDSKNSTAALATKQDELAELGARIELRKNLAVAREYVARAKRAEVLEKLSKVISNGPAKQLTVQSKLASEDLVNKNFEALFTDECSRLRAPSVALHFQGRSGVAQRKKDVASYKPSAVLSEGEQKVLAIADFLAESRMRGSKAPIIFDDPVTSLDYRRLDEVAMRIQELSQSHQVVVLTHNIMFASALLSARQNKKLRTKIYEVRDGGTSKGHLAADVEPRLDTPADLGKRINVKIQAIPTAAAAVQDALVKEAYDLLRAWCEAFVEQELLKNVTQRYRANVMMGGLSKIDMTRFDAAVSVVEPLFARACDRMTGHSHAAEYMSVKPTLDELQEDWKKAQEARLAYIS